jgi:Zn-dependent peptidase ImmA (M78 family)/transcriptional regulator with XRE-family HTH domain
VDGGVVVMIYGERVKLARDVRGLTQAELAKRAGVSQSAIAQIENGTSQPLMTTLDAIAFTTQFPPAFFRRPPSDDFPLGSLSLLYRARNSARSRDLTIAHAWAALVWDAAKEMSQQLEPTTVRLPRLSGTDPTTAARITRSELGLPPDIPLERVMLPIERAGALIFALPISVEGLDAFSVWAGEDRRQPVIVIPRGTAWDRLRFSIAHELAHLVLHSPIAGSLPHLEHEANQFAAEFLLPEEAIRRDVIRPVTLTTLAPLKQKYRASLASLVRRVHDLRLVTETQYRSLMKQLSARGWRTREPGTLSAWAEKPRAIRRMAEVVYGTSADHEPLAAAVRWLLPTAKEILDAHAELSDLRTTANPATASGTVVPLMRPDERCRN